MAFYTQEEDSFKAAYPKAFFAVEQTFKDKKLDKPNFYLGECVARADKAGKEDLEIYYINSSNETLSLWLDIELNNGTVMTIESSYGEDP